VKCPGCGEWVLGTPDSCPHCGCDLLPSQSIAELRRILRRTLGECDAVSGGLRELGERVSSLESLTASRAAQRPSVPPKETASGVELDSVPPLAERPVKAYAPARSHHPPTAAEPSASVAALSRETEVRFGQKWLLIVGLVITVLAVGYFLKYSFDRNWVGPAGRVALAYVAGAAMLAVGEVVRRRFDVFGLYLMGGGIAVLYFASYAAFQVFHLFTQSLSFLVMALVTAFAGLLSIFYDQKWLAVLGVIGGFLTPIVLSTGTDNQVALMSYMLILNAGILGIAAFKQWNLLNYLGLSFTWLLFSTWYAWHYADSKFWTTTIFLNAFFLVYAIVPFAYFFVRRPTAQVAGFAITIPNTFIAFGYSYATIQNHFRLEAVSVVTVAYAAIFLAMAACIHRRNRSNTEVFVLLLAKAMLFLIITVPILFSRHWITIFWHAQGISLLWAALRLADSRLRAGAIAILLVATAKFLFYDYLTVFELRVDRMAFLGGFELDGLERWITTAVTGGALFAAAGMLRAAGLSGTDWRENLVGLFSTLFGGVLFVALNIEVAAFFHDFLPRARFAAISVLWAAFAAALMALGFLRDRSALRRCAIALFAACVLKIFVFDMANVETPYRILSFLVVGLLLVAASYLYHRFAARILAAADSEPQPP